MWHNLTGKTTESTDAEAQGRARAPHWAAFLDAQIAELEALVGDATGATHTHQPRVKKYLLDTLS